LKIYLNKKHLKRDKKLHKNYLVNNNNFWNIMKTKLNLTLLSSLFALATQAQGAESATYAPDKGIAYASRTRGTDVATTLERNLFNATPKGKGTAVWAPHKDRTCESKTESTAVASVASKLFDAR
jgi:hypothetical protein